MIKMFGAVGRAGLFVNNERELCAEEMTDGVLKAGVRQLRNPRFNISAISKQTALERADRQRQADGIKMFDRRITMESVKLENFSLRMALGCGTGGEQLKQVFCISGIPMECKWKHEPPV